MNWDSNELVYSPSTNEGQQSETSALNTAPSASQRPRHNSSARKRTNDQVYEPVQTPVTSPRAIRFDKSITAGGMSDSLTQPSDGMLASGQVVQTPVADEDQNASQKVIAVPSANDKPSSSFVQDIKDYQRELELEFEKFEQSLDERDTSADLEGLDWDDLEERYKKEIQPHVDSEQEIMTEFGSRFQVRKESQRG